MSAQLVNPAPASLDGSVPEEPSTSWLDYPLVLLKANLPPSAWEPLSAYLPLSLDAEKDKLMTTFDAKLQAILQMNIVAAIWSALYIDTALEKFDSLKTLDKDKAMEWATAQYNLLMTFIMSHMNNFQEKAKGQAMEYYEMLDKRFNIQEQYASAVLSFGVVKSQVLAFLSSLWVQLEEVLAGAMENERVVAAKNEIKNWKFASKPQWSEITAWVALFYTTCSEKVANVLTVPSE